MVEIGYFAHCLTGVNIFPENRLDVQYFGDVRKLSQDLFEGVDGVVHLAAISNDPMGDRFEEVTYDINYKASIDLAKEAKAAGVGRFVFASNCSVYGFAEGGARDEQSLINPLTAYAKLDIQSVADVLSIGLQNVPYLFLRSTKAGIDQTILFRTFAYLILVMLDALPAETVAGIIDHSLTRGGETSFPDDVYEVLLMPIIDQLQSEMQDVCGEDCRRIHSFRRKSLVEDKDEIETYWLRLEPDGLEEVNDDNYLRLEGYNEPCKVGFLVDKDKSCPLFTFEPSIKNTQELLGIIKRVVAFRKAQAAAVRNEKSAK